MIKNEVERIVEPNIKKFTVFLKMIYFMILNDKESGWPSVRL